ncbi:DUF5106 domain-containing protein [Parabacteroides sp. 52]|uniref:DUF5106 domain-containing protein n=1 Tax=unclassified Parabacteroides TaxID=2649774 RepID=UPI0013D659D2|nr:MULTISPECIES: DUF5106 domain-containing protein [unclassified Parabacteroides]MDH6534030.1 hypothetical protein [Parabacteroides sp. PM5-20]NDV54772.1 DUF5106 domain-containing protein [Parabacteroides sp. 52]
MKYVYLFIGLLLFYACGNKREEKGKQETEKTLTFEPVSVPLLISEPEQRAIYLIQHYWDTYDFTDTAYVHLPEVTEQAFSNYVAAFSRTDPKEVVASIKAMLKKAEANPVVYLYFTGLYEKYLYDPNAPMRNEEFYIPVLESMLASDQLNEEEKIRPAHLLEIALKNRVGQVATDFKFTLANGKTGEMHALESDYLILFFYNPGCDACRVMTKELAGDPLIQKGLDKKKLILLAVYPDEEWLEWEKHLSELPGQWMNTYDISCSIKENELYDLKAIPTLYLLDRNKVVLLKDATFNQLRAYLYENSQI